MSNEMSTNASAMQDRIDEVLSWEPGDPIYEQDYGSDWIGASNDIPQIRCTECEVYWPEPHEPCWSCGKVVPLAEAWLKGFVGGDRNTDETRYLEWSIEHFEHPAAVYRHMWERVTEQINAVWSDLLLDFRPVDIAIPRQYGRAFTRTIFDEWVSSDPERVAVSVQQSNIELLPPTPKVFDFDLGLPKSEVDSRTTNVPYSNEIVLQIPREIPKAEPLAPIMSDSHLDEINPALFARELFDRPGPSSQLITQVRRSRYV